MQRWIPALASLGRNDDFAGLGRLKTVQRRAIVRFANADPGP
jgi:hypothetical protein